jgi:AcrR family transcriptional regulator
MPSRAVTCFPPNGIMTGIMELASRSPRGRARAAARQDEVLRAARRVIIRKGLADTTLRDIAREGGFTTGVVTHHFPDKRAVIFGAFTSAWTEWVDESRQMFAGAQTPRDLLFALVDQAIPASKDRRDEWRLWSEMWTYAGSDPAFAEQLVRADTSIWESDLAGVVRELQRSGMFRKDLHPEAEATIMNRLTDGLGLKAWLTGRWEDARRDFVRHLASLGLPGDLVEELLRPSRKRPQRRR